MMIRILICLLLLIKLTISLKLSHNIIISSLRISLSLVLLDIDKCNAYDKSSSSTTVLLAKQQIDNKNNDNILLKRLSNKALDAVSYRPGILSTDVYYPSWFNGYYKTSSRFTEVYAPLGEDAFGGSNVLNAAKEDIGSILVYNSKFKQINDLIISDRLYNLKSIAKASMGERSIVDDNQVSKDLANNIKLIVSPTNSGGSFFDIDLQVTDREYNEISNNEFVVLERTKQTIRNVIPQTEFSSQRISPPSLQKEIETITSYKKIDDNTIFGKQRTATYYSILDPRYNKLQAAEPRISDTAVDIRYYELTYNKIQ